MTNATTQFEQSAPLVYMETTIPAGMTIGDYRRSRPRPTRWQRLKQLAGGVQVAAAQPA
jgi:hypothetical protein